MNEHASETGTAARFAPVLQPRPPNHDLLRVFGALLRAPRTLRELLELVPLPRVRIADALAHMKRKGRSVDFDPVDDCWFVPDEPRQDLDELMRWPPPEMVGRLEARAAAVEPVPPDPPSPPDAPAVADRTPRREAREPAPAETVPAVSIPPIRRPRAERPPDPNGIDDRSERVLGALRDAPGGLSRREIERRTGVAYLTLEALLAGLRGRNLARHNGKAKKLSRWFACP